MNDARPSQTSAIAFGVVLSRRSTGFFRGPLERMFRDVTAASYHPLPEKRQLHFTGLLALGRDPITLQPLAT